MTDRYAAARVGSRISCASVHGEVSEIVGWHVTRVMMWP